MLCIFENADLSPKRDDIKTYVPPATEFVRYRQHSSRNDSIQIAASVKLTFQLYWVAKYRLINCTVPSTGTLR